MTTKPFADIGIIVPLQEEFERLCSIFPQISDSIDGTQFHAELASPVDGLRIVAFLQDGMGKSSAAKTTRSLLENYQVGVVVVLGIAGGLSGDVGIGDICITGTVVDVLENSSVKEHNKGGLKVEFAPRYFSTDSRLTFAMKYMSLAGSVKGKYREWEESCYLPAAEAVPATFVGRDGKDESINIPSVHDGNIVCGAVAKSQTYKDSLKGVDRKLLAIETESGGVFEEADSRGVPAISIRGICDYADSNKNRLEEQTGGATRAIAANNATLYLKLQLSNPQFLRYLEGRKPQNSPENPELFPVIPGNDAMEIAKGVVAEQIDSRLRDLSPEYRGKPRGYRLPLPRVQLQERDPLAAKNHHPIDVLEAVVQYSQIALHVPRNYPDKGLAWVIAAELSLIEMEGKQVIPVVVNGELIRPPSNSIRKACDVNIDEVSKCDNCQIVFIVDDIPLESRTKSEFITAQISEFPDAKAIYINRNSMNMALENDTFIRNGAHVFSIREVSFFELTNFLRRTFNMEEQQAGVVALKLRDVFDRFELSAHPSYFAGIPDEMLVQLMNANKRAELIQLAVDGFLTFVVASDRAEVKLSRTTRAIFLRRVIYAMRVEKHNLSHADLVNFAKSFASEKDYDIDPIEFISAFTEKGIIHFDSGVAQITLPFIESYLLASELISRPDDAAKYFGGIGEDFDFATFDLYAELQPSENVVNIICARLDEVINNTGAPKGKGHVLLNDSIRPRLANKSGQLRDVESKIQKAAEDVAKNRPNSREKQQLLDVIEAIGEQTRKADKSSPTNEESREELERLSEPFRVWNVACLLIGAAAEHLDAPTKRSLAKGIVQAGSGLLDRWMQSYPKDAFESFRADITSEESIRRITATPEGGEIPEEARSIVLKAVDAFEFAILGAPFRLLVQFLLDTSGQRVLSASLEKVEADDEMEALLGAVWRSEIDPVGGRVRLLEAIDALPPTPFFRMVLSSHFVTRVFWNHWASASRMALLDAAEASISPLGGRSFDRGRLKRLIES